MVSNRSLRVETAEESKAMLLGALNNEPTTAREIVVLNSGVALYAANVVKTIPSGLELARSVIENGKAIAKLNEFVAFSKSTQAA